MIIIIKILVVYALSLSAYYTYNESKKKLKLFKKLRREKIILKWGVYAFISFASTLTTLVYIYYIFIK